jgi:hypothetical protein
LALASPPFSVYPVAAVKSVWIQMFGFCALANPASVISAAANSVSFVLFILETPLVVFAVQSVGAGIR